LSSVRMPASKIIASATVGPVSCVTWDSPESSLFQRRVDVPLDNLDGARVEQLAHGLLQGEPFLLSETPSRFKDAQPPR
jgi:hypothetical protein